MINSRNQARRKHPVLHFEKNKLHTKIAELMDGLQDRDIPMIHEDAEIEDIIDLMVKTKHTRLLYVVDKNDKLIGTISLGLLVRHVFSHRHEPQIHSRFLMHAITTKTADHMMQKHPVFAREEDNVEKVIKRMIKSNVKEIAILNSEKKVIGDLTMVDLLNFLMDGTETQKDSEVA